MEDTLKRCDIDPGEELSSGLGKSRKERAYNFLISVMLNDVYILALKDVLEYRGLHELVDLQEETELSSGKLCYVVDSTHFISIDRRFKQMMTK